MTLKVITKVSKKPAAYIFRVVEADNRLNCVVLQSERQI
jgi:hypothetical protein